jgi:predicted DNA-binding transcriptional regulator YafY
MSRSTRLLELLIVLQTKTRFTVAEMAAEFAVSRRTMLRDLQAISEMGVPLAATPGPGGGYTLIRDRGMLPLSLSADEAIGVVLSYEAFLQHAHSPFAAQSYSAMTKLRNAMPAAIVRELDRVHECVVVVQPTPAYEAPLLADILQAALDHVHLMVEYESISRVASRLVYPYGLYAAQGFWYCACYDYDRRKGIGLRVDRIRTLQRQTGIPPAPAMSVRGWLAARHLDDVDPVRIHVRVTPRGAKRFELSVIFGEDSVDADGYLHADVPRSELPWFASQLLTLGTDVVVDAPPELMDLITREASAILAMYSGS